MNARAPRWSCSQGAVGSADPAEYTLRPDELRWHDYPSLAPLSDAPCPASEPPRVLGLDCEMVTTTAGAELARVSLVELVDGDARWPAREPERDHPRVWTPHVLLDAFVRPEHPVVDYLTEFSGVTAADLERATLTASDAREQLRALVRQGDILCGHGLANDLRALGVSHARVIDTLVLYPHHDGPPAKRSLDGLALEHLRRTIQTDGHSSVEDAAAALALVRLRVESRQGRVVWAPIAEGEPCVFEAPTLPLLLDRMRLAPDDVRCVYLRGSRAVGYAGLRGDGSASDWDFVIVTADRGAPQEDVHLSYGNLEAVLYDERTFLRLVQDCCIWALECIFAPPACVLAEQIDFRAAFARHRERAPREVLHAELRRSVSYESGRQWHKAKRFLVQKGDGYACRKRMFIALRFLHYGIEVARTGTISDLGGANHLWERLRSDRSATWGELRRAHEPLFREMRATFCREAPRLPRHAGPRLQGARGRGSAADASLVPVTPRVEPGRGRDAPLETIRLLRALDRGDPIAALTALQRTFHLVVRQHARAPGVVQLRYTPQSAPRDHPVVRECRGLVLDAERDWELLAYPFDRFFDLKERRDGVDWSTARVYPKLDGSLAILYWYDGAWHVASSRRPDAGGLVGTRSAEGGVAFRELFWAAWRRHGWELPPPEESRRCFMFELTSRRHPIVVRHAEERLTLIGARDLDTLRELDPAVVAAARGWDCLSPVDPNTLEGAEGATLEQRVQAAALRLDASLQEGFVVCDARFRRVKVKSPDYVRMTWMFPLCAARGTLGRQRLLFVLLAGEAEEFLAYCPEHREALEAVRERFDALVAAVDAAYEALAGTPDARAFASAAGRHFFADALFLRRTRRLSTLEALRRMAPKKLERWLSRLAPR